MPSNLFEFVEVNYMSLTDLFVKIYSSVKIFMSIFAFISSIANFNYGL